ncbi:potential anaphase-promoting complex processivity factor [Pseudozyma hubeiensis SY62]|uniref:Potential anaphase-promoting complex processivity factor n=1 Tax=Pseudozyma hubeiensis (strain SY62) TaxID=1305764 RepID=R9PMV4_PSEHS|nr:potential anaphase-promoting complex processivity factor [Pseudozyma hubeiensis SY62]GAC99435.1 potential anaphase-promoting complex processivity factor [Pseudozyma hubeiensis SY62]
MERDAVASTSRGATVTSPTPSSKRRRSRRIYDIEDRTTKTDVGSSPGTHWTLSSYKPGSGVSELRSADLTKLWQSDGNQPHLINIQFARRTCVTHLSIFLDVKQDDSYTPTRIAVKAGTNYHDLTLVRQRTFDAPQGWKHFNMTPGSVDAVTVEEEEDGVEGEEEDLTEAGGDGAKAGGGPGDEGDDDDDDEEGESEGIKVWLIQICILANHLNGKDTHIRRLVVFGPKQSHAISSHGTKRGATNGLAHSTIPPPLRPQNGQASYGRAQNVTLAQLLSLQSAASTEDRNDEVDDDDDSAAGAGLRRSGLNLFGNIR